MDEAERQERKLGFLESAATCFRQAMQPSLQRLAEARLLKERAKEAARVARAAAAEHARGGGSNHRNEARGEKGGERHRAAEELYLAAAEACLAAKLGKEAAFCLAQGKDFERAAPLYSAEGNRTGDRDALLRAAKCFTKLRRFDDSIEVCLTT